MEFANSTFLYALIALAIPIIIHLFNFRKFKRVYFSNVQFLKEVKEETKAKSQLKHWLVLLSRLMTVAFLVLAFAQPFIPAAHTESEQLSNAISIYVDNSFSMDGQHENGRLLDLAKKYAIDIARTYDQTDRFQLVTNDFKGSHQRFFSRERFEEIVGEIQLSSSVKNISQVMSRQKSALDAELNKHKILYALSDFQIDNFDLENLRSDPNIDFRFVPLQPELTDNLYIDSCWFDNPSRMINSREKLNIRIKNGGDKNFENVPLNIKINDIQKGLTSFSIDAKSTIDTSISFTNSNFGIQYCDVSLTDYPVVFDDHYFISYSVSKGINIAIIGNSDTLQNIQRLFKTDSFFLVSSMRQSQVDYETIKRSDLVIIENLNELSSGLVNELGKFNNEGGAIAIFPGNNIDVENYMSFLKRLGIEESLQLDTANINVAAINTNHKIYRDVFQTIPDNIDLPYVNWHYKLSTEEFNNSEVILSMENNDGFLLEYKKQGGSIYLFTSSLAIEANGLIEHAIIVPTLYNIALTSMSGTNLAYELSQSDGIKCDVKGKSADDVYKLKQVNSNFEFIPGYQSTGNGALLHIPNEVQQSGNYALLQGIDTIRGIALNYARKESNLTITNFSEHAEVISQLDISVLELMENQISTQLREIDEGKKLWKTCIILALLFLAFEVALLRFWR